MPTNVASTGLARGLAARSETPIRIGLVGAVEMGAAIVAHAPGVEIGGVSEATMRAVPAPEHASA